MCRCPPAKSTGKHRDTTIFSLSAAPTYHTPPNRFNTLIKDDKVNVLIEVKDSFQFALHSGKSGKRIVTFGMLTIHAVNHRFTLGISL